MAVDKPSGGLGAKLRDARERRGVSLRQIANATKISTSALEALERNDISRLPGGIFSRAFVRSYAVEVGLDPDAAIQEFVAQFPADAATPGHVAADTVEDLVSLDNGRRVAAPLLWLAVVSVLIVGALAYYAMAWRGSTQHSAPVAAVSPAPEPPRAVEVPSPDPASPEPAAPAPPPVVTPPAVVDAPAATANPPAAAATPAPLAASAALGDNVTVTLSVKRPCWVSASVDGEKRIERLMQPGDQQTIEARRELVLTAGDASAIALAFNGAAARPLGKAGEVVTARFNLNNYKDYVLQSR
jgi:cytoskeleton protein RodZ